jgi:fatty-acyl-CoA synthase
MKPTPTIQNLPLRRADFANLAEALDYAALGESGANFYKKDGELQTVLPYRRLRREARALAQRLLSLKPERGARVAILAETHPDFLRFFFACQYAGLVPVPLPISVHMGGYDAFVFQLRKFIVDSRAEIAVAPTEYLSHLNDAVSDLDLRFSGSPADFDELPRNNSGLQPASANELAYLQYTSGSTRFPRGVMITQETVMNNLSVMIRFGVNIRRGDRGLSWLPFYHDMGLVGMVLGAVASQMSVDYLSPVDFVMRPRLWLTLMSRNQATISFSPPVGYELCLKRIKKHHIDALDLSAWRVAGVGAEPIRLEPLNRFAEVFKLAGFDKRAFVAGYGMAECSLAVSFSPLVRELKQDIVDPNFLSEFQIAMPVDADLTGSALQGKSFVNCGEPLPGYEVEVRNDNGRVLPDRHVGTLYVRGPSVMTGYFDDPEATRQVLSHDGWFNTGDIAYRVGRDIIITGREKDMIIINGRNIWPQDLEYIAESQPEVRSGNASAFAATDPTGNEKAVLVIQCREQDESLRADLNKRVQKLVHRGFGIDCFIELVPRHTLPRTTSGKLSRSRARKDFLNRMTADRHRRWQAAHKDHRAAVLTA